MTGKFYATHAALIGIILAISGFITWSAVDARASLDNLVVVAPVAGVIALLAVILVAVTLLKPAPAPAEGEAGEAPSKDPGIWGDMLLLAGFGVFCYALTKVGFDLATFLFVWAGVVMSGGKGWWQPPLYAALFTAALVYGFGSLFPYPMLTLVL
ncbi:tripartite tricarboxylate transporter TctB family protein [Pseudooceanicola marinus]|uniref:tripartite tricarboxylate transporter TctB family protein n=1 Tax=Pseudooceanicola marinus TaxID=396013 RepID=UPI001CD76208|nr:tripartite tricarboxylate transporter TctB family protein [Pseudooceanicola marinus]MCA1337085.1 tripartite tricarboxylate transporter TctB family protein [Pseudooceanicola marinus]